MAHYNFKLYCIENEDKFKNFCKNPESFVNPKSMRVKLAEQINLSKILSKTFKFIHKQYDVVSLTNKKLSKGFLHLIAYYDKEHYCFENISNLKKFLSAPHLFINTKLPIKLPIENEVKKPNEKEEDCTTYLDNNMGNIIMKVLAQLGILFFFNF